MRRAQNRRRAQASRRKRVKRREMSSCVLRRGSRARLHELDELVEQAGHVVRAGTRLRMSLKTERRSVGEPYALKRAVEQRTVRRFHVRGQRRFVDRETM